VNQNMSNYTAAELASLAPEERAALETAAGDPDGILSEIAAGGEQAAAAAASPAPAAAAAAPAAATEGAAAAPAAAPAAATPAAPAPSPAPAPAAAAPASEPPAAPAPSAVVYRANVGDVQKDIQAQKDAIKAARTDEQAALKKLNDGEITFEEYSKVRTDVDTKVDAANDKILEINRAVARAEVSVELTAQQQANAWKGMLNDYVKVAKGDGLDFQANEALRGEFNSLLKAFASEASDKGLSDDNNMEASRWALDQAKQIMAIRHPKPAAPSPAPAPGAAAPAAGAPAAPAAPAASPAPAAAALNGLQTLSTMPSAAAAPVADDVMSKIGALEGEELEVYMASLPRDVYARVTASAQ
jgi:hypothetical protein